MSAALSVADATILAAFAAGFAPEPKLTVSEWADRYRFLSPKASAEPGKWRTSRTPYLREIMDCLSPSDPVQAVVVMAAAQVGKTECGNNWIGYVIDKSPAPMLMVQPTVEMAMKASKQRIAPMIDASPTLRSRVREARSRDSGNTLLVKEFDGGLLAMTGSNSPASLRSLPIGRLFLDEVDAYEGDVGDEGDPVALAEARTTTFARRKILYTSTPTVHGLSRIQKLWLASDQRRYYLACPECGARDYVRWENIRWEEGRPETAALACVACGSLIHERHKGAMLEGGEWRATAPGPGKAAGFHIPGMLSPPGWLSWGAAARRFLEVKNDPPRFKTFVNTVWGEAWEERGSEVDPESLLARSERYPADVPHGVGCLVCAVDVQGDRLEALVTGYGAAEQSWFIAFQQIFGDPATDQPWFDLDAFRRQPFRHEGGQIVPVTTTVVDSGGEHTEQVYRYCKARQGERVFPIKGGSVSGLPLVGRPSLHNRYNVPLFVICTDTGKEIVLARLAIQEPGAGYVHLAEWTDQEFVDQLTAEKGLRKWKRGRGYVREWVKQRERNEAFDLAVYSLAALYINGQPYVRELPERAAELSRPPAPEAPTPTRPAGRRRGGWATNF